MQTILTESGAGNDLIKQLETVARSGQTARLQLPNGAMVLVVPDDGFKAMQHVMQQAGFVKNLESALQDVEKGRIEPFDDFDRA